MLIGDRASAKHLLHQLNYYRLSGYWYPMRRFSPATRAASDQFRKGASFELVVNLYKFDDELRRIVFVELGRLELAIRSMIGHELGRIDPLAHLNPASLGALARQQNPRRAGKKPLYDLWLHKYQAALKRSSEDFVKHHNQKYGGKLPVWAAVEIMDWGALSRLYDMASNPVRDKIARSCGLTAPQFGSWLQSLNIVRNYAAHHARMFNRVYGMKPRLPKDGELASLQPAANRTFGQLSLIQYLHRHLGTSPAIELPELLRRYPDNSLVPFSRLGAPEDWNEFSFWK